MNAIARIVKTDTGESIEVADGFGFDASEVRLVRVGDRVFLEAADAIDEETGLPMQRLRELVQEGIDSGPSEKWDVEEIKRQGRERLAQRPRWRESFGVPKLWRTLLRSGAISRLTTLPPRIAFSTGSIAA